MRYLGGGFLLVFLSASTNVQVQNKPEEQAVRKLPQAFCDAFTNHDGRALEKIWPRMWISSLSAHCGCMVDQILRGITRGCLLDASRMSLARICKRWFAF